MKSRGFNEGNLHIRARSKESTLQYRMTHRRPLLRVGEVYSNTWSISARNLDNTGQRNQKNAQSKPAILQKLALQRRIGSIENVILVKFLSGNRVMDFSSSELSEFRSTILCLLSCSMKPIMLLSSHLEIVHANYSAM